MPKRHRHREAAKPAKRAAGHPDWDRPLTEEEVWEQRQRYERHDPDDECYFSCSHIDVLTTEALTQYHSYKGELLCPHYPR